jgi:hypothetical protein
MKSKKKVAKKLKKSKALQKTKTLWIQGMPGEDR